MRRNHRLQLFIRSIHEMKGKISNNGDSKEMTTDDFMDKEDVMTAIDMKMIGESTEEQDDFYFI